MGHREGDTLTVTAHVTRLLAVALGLLLCPLAARAQIVEYYHLDGIGSVLAVTDQSGTVVESHDYLPFGEEWCGTSVCGAVTAGQPKRFTGKERDAETGLDYFGARYYGSKIGRFTTVDPFTDHKAALVNPQKWNRYAYGLNNPLRYVDPDGREGIPGLEWNVQQQINQQTWNYGGRFLAEQIAMGLLTGGLGEVLFGGEVLSPVARGGLGLFEGASGTGAPIGALALTGVQARKAVGDAWSRVVGAELKATQEVAVPEITVRTQSGARTRLDWVTKDSSGRIGCVECKASSTAPLTAGQAAAHPEIAETGAVVVGKGKPGVPGGTVIPPTRVQVRRPE